MTGRSLQFVLQIAILMCMIGAYRPIAMAMQLEWPKQDGSQAVGDPEAGAALANAKELIGQGRLAEAEAVLRNYLDGHANSVAAHLLLGLVEYHENKPGDSLKEFTRAAQLKKPGANELVVVALDYLKLKDIENADRWMLLAIKMAPENGMAWRYMGGIKYSENRFSEAIDSYRRCLSLRPQDVLGEDGLGRSYEGLTEDEDATAAYKTALDWQSRAGSKYPQPLLHLGSLLVRQGRYREATPYLIAAEALAPDDEEVHEQLGESYARLNQLGKAQAELEKAIELAPKDSRPHWLLASVYRREGLANQAELERQAFSELLGSHSNDKIP